MVHCIPCMTVAVRVAAGRGYQIAGHAVGIVAKREMRELERERGASHAN